MASQPSNTLCHTHWSPKTNMKWILSYLIESFCGQSQGDSETVMSIERHDISNHCEFDCLLNSLFRLTEKKKNQSTTLLALGERNPMVTGASNAERISMSSYDICLWETWIWPVSQVIRGIYDWSYIFLALTHRYHHIYPWGLSVPGLTLSWFYSQHYHGVMVIKQIDGLVQERRNSSALAMELRLSCINPSKWCWMKPT